MRRLGPTLPRSSGKQMPVDPYMAEVVKENKNRLKQSEYVRSQSEIKEIERRKIAIQKRKDERDAYLKAIRKPSKEPQKLRSLSSPSRCVKLHIKPEKFCEEDSLDGTPNGSMDAFFGVDAPKWSRMPNDNLCKNNNSVDSCESDGIVWPTEIICSNKSSGVMHRGRVKNDLIHKTSGVIGKLGREEITSSGVPGVSRSDPDDVYHTSGMVGVRKIEPVGRTEEVSNVCSVEASGGAINSGGDLVRVVHRRLPAQASSLQVLPAYYDSDDELPSMFSKLDTDEDIDEPIPDMTRHVYRAPIFEAPIRQSAQLLNRPPEPIYKCEAVVKRSSAQLLKYDEPDRTLPETTFTIDNIPIVRAPPINRTLAQRPKVQVFQTSSSHQGFLDRPSQQSVIDQPSQQSVINKASQQSVIDRTSQQSVIDRPSQQSVIDRPSQQSVIDRPSLQSVINKASQQSVKTSQSVVPRRRTLPSLTKPETHCGRKPVVALHSLKRNIKNDCYSRKIVNSIDRGHSGESVWSLPVVSSPMKHGKSSMSEFSRSPSQLIVTTDDAETKLLASISELDEIINKRLKNGLPRVIKNKRTSC
eukprot:GHVL01009508.1.p1 GENE.GHVL01009508.1~~GHVL01009508.1.p1  ORF type:complete len:584 (+),score=96.59 GHVL01009508.1:1914-3665(+)